MEASFQENARMYLNAFIVVQNIRVKGLILFCVFFVIHILYYTNSLIDNVIYCTIEYRM